MGIAEIGPWITAAKDAALGGAAVFTAFYAARGLRTWRAELKGKSEYQLAKDVLKAVYRVRERITYVRNGIIMAEDYPDELKEPWESTKPENQYKAIGYVYQQRLNLVDEAFHDLEGLNLDAQVEWGADFGEAIKKLRKCRVTLRGAIFQHVWDMAPHTVPEEKTEEEKRRQHAIMYETSHKKYDDFNQEIREAIAEFETRLRPHISAKK